MPIELTQLLSVLSCLIAAFALYRNLKGDTKTDAGQMTEIIVKLEIMKDDIKEIKLDLKEVREDIDNMKERLLIVEQSTKSAHKRLDDLGKEKEERNTGT